MSKLSLTTSQQLVWLGQQLQPNSPLNNMAFALRWRKEIDVAAFQQAFEDLVKATESMRLRFEKEEGEVVQAIGGGGKNEISKNGKTEISVFPFFEISKNQKILDFLTQKSTQPLDLTGPLFDAALYQLGPAEYVFYFNQHHLITDGWGKSLQINWLTARYDFLTGNRSDPPGELGSFTDYAQQFTSLVTAENTVLQSEYWKKKVAEFPVLPLLYGRGNPEFQLSSTRVVHTLTSAQSTALRNLCQAPDVRAWSTDLALFNVLLTALYAYVYRISGQRKLAIGAPAHNRLTTADQQVPGLYIELFPLYLEIDEKETFSSLLEKVKTESMNFLRNAKPGSSSTATGRSFNVLFNFINTSFNEAKDPTLDVTWLHPGETETGHHLKLQVYDFASTGQLDICLDVNHAILPATETALAHRQFMETLEQLMDNRHQYIGLPGKATVEALSAFNYTDESYPTHTTIPQLIAERCALSGDKIAVIAGSDQLTYRQLDERSSQLAHYLLDHGLQSEELVAICLDRSVEMMVGLLGIMKAGGAYVPIDPGYPQKRIDFLLEDTGARFVVTEDKFSGFFTTMAPENVVVPSQDFLRKLPITPVNVTLDPEQLIYVIYTSGSTGVPKGVMNNHPGPLNRIIFGQQTFQLNAATDVVLQKTTFCFDVSVWELFWPLLQGARLVMAAPELQGDPAYLKRIIQQAGVTVLHFVPPMLQAFLEAVDPGELPTIRKVFCSGEALKPEHVNAFNTRLPHAQLHNLYGPTEAGIEVTHWPAPQGVTNCKLVPIGKPIANVPLYILNESGEFCPINVPGELYIGGIQVARGYHRRPELTAEKFVELLLPGSTKAVRLYRTGDLTRWLANGEIEFLGRIDSQVKVRGFRIELGEIENVLAAMPGYRQGVVITRADLGEELQLVAYLTTTTDETNASAVKSFLAERLPAYMVPAFVVFLRELPLLPNGKINRNALPSPAGADIIDTEPQNDFEAMIMQAWTETLELPAVGRQTSFFDLGGHSLSGIRLVNRINSDFELELPAATIFRYPTVAALAAHVEAVIRKLIAEMDENG